MSKYIDAEKLLAEIVRLKKRAEHIYEISLTNDERSFWSGESSSLTLLATFVTSLQQEQPEVDLENYISSKLRELGADLTDPFNRGFDAGKTNAYNDILDKLNVRKEESVSVAESPSSTFPRVNEFDCGSSYRH